ncbi:MAG: helix-turn-helix domain-containing protein [Enterococcus durans]
MNIGDNIKEIRTIKGLTQQELADKIGISRSYLGDLEKNRRNPSSETIEKLSEMLGVSIFYLMRGIKTQQDEKFFKDEEMKETIAAFIKKRPVDVINRMKSIENIPENRDTLEILYYTFSLLDTLNVDYEDEIQSEIIKKFFESLEKLDNFLVAYRIIDKDTIDDKTRFSSRENLNFEFEDYKVVQSDLMDLADQLIESI